MNTRTQGAPVVSALASFATSISWETVPAEVALQAKLTLLDTVGCMLAGAPTMEGRRFMMAELGQARTRGDDLSNLDTAAWARVLGYWGDIFELNDLIGGHAGIGNVSAVVAATRDSTHSGADVLNALIAGVEVTSRISEAHYLQKKPYGDCNSVAVGFQSAMGAAAAIARLKGADADTAANAMAIAGSLASWCPAEVIFGDGGTIKPVLFGACPADSALRGVAYAQAGLSGPPRILESPLGFFADVAGGYDRERLVESDNWYLSRPQRKLHACCGFIHSSIDVGVTLRQRGVDLCDAEAIHIYLPPYIIPAVSKHSLPTSENDARFHLQYCFALAADGIDVIVPENSENFASYLQRPKVRAIMERIVILPLEREAETNVKLFNLCEIAVIGPKGEIARERTDAPRGSNGNPLTRRDLLDKFEHLALRVTEASEVKSMQTAIMSLERQSDLSALTALLQRSAHRTLQS